MLAVALAALLGGCGDDEGTPAAGTGPGEPGEGGTLSWALEEGVVELDPLFADTRAERLVSHQIHEPLAGVLAGPFEDPRRVGGLAASVRETRDPTIWRVELRQGVRFQDGTRMNAAAVLANVSRWQASPVAREILGQSFEADAPRPHMVRFILGAPDPGFGRRLGAERLGIVSRRALADAGAGPIDGVDTGTGAFELRERERDRLLLARNTGWWGSERDLGPALAQVVLLRVPSADERLRLLHEGDVQVADGIGRAGMEAIRADPLLFAQPEGGGRWRGLERSVRGIDPGAAPTSLQQVWLTRIGT